MKKSSMPMMMFAYAALLFFMVMLCDRLFPIDTVYIVITAILLGASLMYLAYTLYRGSKYRELTAFFTAAALSANGRYPKVLEKNKTGGSITYVVQMPAGLSSEDFEKKRLALEQYLKADVIIEFKGNLWITATPRTYS